MSNTLNKTKPNKAKKLLSVLAAVAFWLAVWVAVCYLVRDAVLLPGPIDTVKALGALVVTEQFYLDVLATLLRCAIGIVVSFLSGVALAFAAHRFGLIRTLLSLPVRFLKATPVMAVIIYAIIILTSDSVPVLVCFLMCFPIVYVNVLSGLDNMNIQFIEMFQVFGVQDRYSKLYFPSVFPEMKASLDLIAGLSWKSVVAAEVLSVPDFSMGYNLMNAKYYLETPSLFAWIAAIVFVSWLFETLIRLITNRWEFREYSKSKIKLKNRDSGSDSVNVSAQSPQSVEIRNVTKTFGEKTVFNDLSMHFSAGKITGLMAPSGFGKTTLFRMIAGLDKPDFGTITGSDRISFLFQEDRLLPWLNLYDNLALVLKDVLNRKEAERRIEKILKTVELWDDRNKLPMQLSGGMRQRVSMARAFIYPADLMLIDEPFKGLDAELKTRIINGAWKNTTAGKTVIFASHDKEEALMLADKMIMMGR